MAYGQKKEVRGRFIFAGNVAHLGRSVHVSKVHSATLLSHHGQRGCFVA